MTARTWTPESATAALPLVRRIVADLTAAYQDWKDAVGAFEVANAARAADGDRPDAEALTARAQKLAAEIDGFRAELVKLGVEVLRIEHGLVAFASGDERTPIVWMPGLRAATYDWPESVPRYETAISWPSRDTVAAGKRSRA